MSNDAAFEAVTALMGAYARATRTADAKLGGLHGLSLSELELLLAINNQEAQGARPADLARALHMTASGVTRALLPLEKRGIVKREPDKTDARASRVRLTVSGDELANRAAASANEAAARALRRLSLGQTRQLIRLLEEIGE